MVKHIISVIGQYKDRGSFSFIFTGFTHAKYLRCAWAQGRKENRESPLLKSLRYLRLLNYSGRKARI